MLRAFHTRRPSRLQVATDPALTLKEQPLKTPTGPPLHADRPMFLIFRDFTVQD